MLGYLKTRAQATSYNKGWRTKVKLYDEIAGDPEKIIAGAEILCKIDETQGSLVDGTKCTIRETLDAVSNPRVSTCLIALTNNRWTGTPTTSTLQFLLSLRNTRMSLLRRCLREREMRDAQVVECLDRDQNWRWSFAAN